MLVVKGRDPDIDGAGQVYSPAYLSLVRLSDFLSYFRHFLLTSSPPFHHHFVFCIYIAPIQQPSLFFTRRSSLISIIIMTDTAPAAPVVNGETYSSQFLTVLPTYPSSPICCFVADVASTLPPIPSSLAPSRPSRTTRTAKSRSSSPSTAPVMPSPSFPTSASRMATLHPTSPRPTRWATTV